MEGGGEVNYEAKYKFLKKKLKVLVFEQECFLSDLRKAQKKLLKVARDKSFLLDRLLQYEKPELSPGDSDATDDTDDNTDPPPAKKKKQSPGQARPTPQFTGFTAAPPPDKHKGADSGKKKTKGSGKKAKKAPQPPRREGAGRGEAATPPPPPAQISREELERRLDAKVTIPEIPKAELQMPSDIFGGPDSDGDIEEELVIDMAD